MPLSKKRDKARKRLERAMAVQPQSNPEDVQPTVKAKLEAVGLSLEGNVVQTRPRIVSPVGRSRPKRRDEMTPEELGITGHDADGNALYEE